MVLSPKLGPEPFEQSLDVSVLGEPVLSETVPPEE
jgi:hypothetical protein